MTEFVPSSVAYGLSFGAFSHLSRRDRKRLARLMARISEASFRRGYQHGAECSARSLIDPYELRYERSLERSPHPDNPRTADTSLGRLFAEYGVLAELGFESATPAAEDHEPTRDTAP